jgi:hypothetical protein
MVGEAAVGWLDLKILDWGILLDQYQDGKEVVRHTASNTYGGWLGLREIHPYIQSTVHTLPPVFFSRLLSAASGPLYKLEATASSAGTSAGTSAGVVK